MQLHSLVGGPEPETLIEGNRVGPALVRGQLHHVAASFPGAADRPLYEAGAETLSPESGRDPNRLYLRPPAAAVGQIREEAQLQRGHHRTFVFRHDQVMVGLLLDRPKSVVV